MGEAGHAGAPWNPYPFIEALEEFDLIRQGVHLGLELHLVHVGGVHILGDRERSQLPSPALPAFVRRLGFPALATPLTLCFPVAESRPTDVQGNGRARSMPNVWILSGQTLGATRIPGKGTQTEELGKENRSHPCPRD